VGVLVGEVVFSDLVAGVGYSSRRNPGGSASSAR